MHKLNLLPKEVLINRSKKKCRLIFILIISILSVILVCSLVFINNSKSFLENEIYNTSQEVINMKAEMQNRSNYENILKDYETRQNVYKDLMKSKLNYSRILNQTIFLISEGITVNALKIDTSNYLRIDGYAPSISYVAQIMEDIKTIDGVIDITLGFTRFAETKNEIDHCYHFEIVIKLTED